jgi:hypothetical protein
MIFRIIYNQEYKRTIPAVLIDSRGSISAIQTAGGFAVKAYTDSQVALVTDTIIPYKIETDLGNLAGYFNLQVKFNVTVTLKGKQLRPAFQQFDNQISQIINNFISSNDWKEDYLF